MAEAESGCRLYLSHAWSAVCAIIQGAAKRRDARSGVRRQRVPRFTDPFYAADRECFGIQARGDSESEALCDGLRRIAFAAGEEPVDWFANVVFFGFAHDAGDGLSGFVEDDGAGNDVAEAEV